jgi:hypothetical protein
MGERRELGAGGGRCAIVRWRVMHAMVVVCRLGVTLVHDVVRMVVLGEGVRQVERTS